jgi:hypothetical protein
LMRWSGWPCIPGRSTDRFPGRHHRPFHDEFIRMVERPVSVPKIQASPFGASGNSSRTSAMIARPSSTTGAVRTSFAPRGRMRRSSTKGQLTISPAGMECLVASAAHAASARAINACRCSADQCSSNITAKSETAHTRQDDRASDSQLVFASSLACAASMRYLKKTPMATSYAQKPRAANMTGCVLLTCVLETGLLFQTCRASSSHP